ncbi:low temperature requirement protein A [Kibdelosporangium philippinense]|uniref:Low temperature requirement protein A n=2 Tax=Kibdelosporangium philippinense TaxID=211113 RepID=A0ABS8Z2G4_9PSEU|nr:low temperature requirement protein A [Kibdelosporangium philippinense]MCE7001965.1 low temperature requirement protein A [Kibdelosporangium philippinense]
MRPRGRHERHRTATPLELFFDLCVVVAVAQAGSQLAHALGDGHIQQGIAGYLVVFFSIWWAWMNFTWFASAYDTDDVPYRITTFVVIAGALIMAAGVPDAFASSDLTVAVAGYVVMRFAMAAQWFRAAAATTGKQRTVALRYAVGMLLVQLYWVLWVTWIPVGARSWTYFIGPIADLAVPVVAERVAEIGWHPGHIADRYGSFTLIVLGESVAATTIAVQSAVDGHEALRQLWPIAAGGLLICFAAWWIYFANSAEQHLRSNRQAFVWGYGHYVVFLAVAAIGAGLEVAVKHSVGSIHISQTAATLGVTIPAALYFFAVWMLHARHTRQGAAAWVLPLAAVAVLASPSVLVAGLVCAAAVAAGLGVGRARFATRARG